MCMEQRVKAVSNTCRIENRNLLVVTGANQGGKSPFLRSIGIAQVMFQCGLQVTASSFATRVYEEAGNGTREGVAFLSAERREDGRRTFRMIEHAPELTSFGLDFYDSIIPPMKKEM